MPTADAAPSAAVHALAKKCDGWSFGCSGVPGWVRTQLSSSLVRSTTVFRWPGLPVTMPAAASSASARCAVLGATFYRAARSFTEGSAAPGGRTPLSIAPLRSAAIRSNG
jgi:hypothetical protein